MLRRVRKQSDESVQSDNLIPLTVFLSKNGQTDTQDTSLKASHMARLSPAYRQSAAEVRSTYPINELCIALPFGRRPISPNSITLIC